MAADDLKRVTVVVPTYNQAQYLPTALDSLLAQTYEHWEAVVVNDGSTDGTAEIVDEYARSDDRFKAVHKENGGISSALNRGLAEAGGDYFCWLSSDDFFLPPKLASQLTVFNRILNAGIVVSGFNHVDPEGRTIGGLRSTPEAETNPEANLILHGNFINGCTAMIPMRVVSEVGGFNSRYRYAQDYDMWTRIALRHRVVWLPEVLVSYRVHPGQGSATGEIDCLIDSLVIIHEILQNNSAKQVTHIAPDSPSGVDRFIEYMVNAVAWQFSWINFPQVNQDVWEWAAANLRHRMSPAETAQLLARVAEFLQQNVHHRHVGTNLESLGAAIQRMPSILPFSSRAHSREAKGKGSSRKSGQPRVALTALGGVLREEGWETLARLANWLSDLDVDVCVYSDRSPPQSVSLEARLAIVSDPDERYRGIREPLVLVSSLAEIPVVQRNTTGRKRLIHLCLGNEDLAGNGGYGDAADPSAQVEYLRRLPIERIVTSEDDRAFFQRKNREEPYLISQGADSAARGFDEFVKVFERILKSTFDRGRVEGVRAGLR